MAPTMAITIAPTLASISVFSGNLECENLSKGDETRSIIVWVLGVTWLAIEACISEPDPSDLSYSAYIVYCLVIRKLMCCFYAFTLFHFWMVWTYYGECTKGAETILTTGSLVIYVLSLMMIASLGYLLWFSRSSHATEDEIPPPYEAPPPYEEPPSYEA